MCLTLFQSLNKYVKKYFVKKNLKQIPSQNFQLMYDHGGAVIKTMYHNTTTNQRRVPGASGLSLVELWSPHCCTTDQGTGSRSQTPRSRRISAANKKDKLSINSELM